MVGAGERQQLMLWRLVVIDRVGETLFDGQLDGGSLPGHIDGC